MADRHPIDVASAQIPPNQRHSNESDSDKTLEVNSLQTSTTSPGKPPDDIPPNGGYGWVCVACNFFINGHTWGVNSSYGVFLSYYLSHDYFPNTSPLVYAFIGGLSMSMALLIAPLATHVIHRFGTRTCLYLGVFFETLSLIGASFATKKYQIILSQGICFGWGMGFIFVGSVGIIAQWFTTKRSVANAIAAAGSGLGGLMYSLVAQRVIDTMGLPWAFRILGICTFVVNLTAGTLLRDRNKAVGSRHVGFDFQLFKRPEFLLMQGWGFFSMLGYTVLLFSLASYATSIGLTPQQGSVVSALLNLGQMLGRPCIGLASDRFGRLNLASSLSALCGLLCLAFWIPAEIASSQMGLLVFFAIIGGALAGTFWCTIAAVGAEVVGLKDLPAALSMTWLFLVPPTTFAEPIALELRRRGTNSWIFLYAQVFTALMYVASGICLWIVRGWKVGEMEAAQRILEERMARGSVTLQQQDQQQAREKGGAPPLVEDSIPEVTAKEGWNGRSLIRRMCKRIVV